MLEVVIDTLIMNTIVGLLVIVSGAYTTSGPEQALLDTIFHDPYFIGQITMTVCLIFFAFTSIVAWSYYGSSVPTTCGALLDKNTIIIFLFSSYS